MRYEDFVRKVCGDDWKAVSLEERQGGYGVACMAAFMRNAKPSVNEMANHLGIISDEIYMPFTRLARAGAFNQRWNAKRDKALLSHMGDDEAQRAWSHIAAIASGFIGV
jgi:hypothetical protein